MRPRQDDGRVSRPTVRNWIEVQPIWRGAESAGTAVKAFLQSAIGPEQKGLADDGNVPLPDDFKSKLSAAINAIA
jgi:hypothetical protein